MTKQKMSQKQAWRQFRNRKVDEHYDYESNIQELMFVEDEERRNVEESLLDIDVDAEGHVSEMNRRVRHVGKEIMYVGASQVDVDEDYDCTENGHFDAVSGCCGGRQHEYIEGMCNSCNEMTSWMCSVCDEDISDEVYN